MYRVDAWITRSFQHVYGLLWAKFSVPIGTFRLLITIMPVVIDTGLEFHVGGLRAVAFGASLYVVAVCLLYPPTHMLRDNRLQACGSHALLNSASILFARRTRFLRLFYLLNFALTFVLFRRISALMLVNTVYARCVHVPKQQRHEAGLSSFDRSMTLASER